MAKVKLSSALVSQIRQCSYLLKLTTGMVGLGALRRRRVDLE